MGNQLLTVSERLNWLRAKTGRSSRQVALATGIGASYLSRIEKGNRVNPSEKVIQKLADYYGANAEWIKTGNGKSFSQDELGRAKNQLFELLENLDGPPAASREEQVLSNIGARVAQFKFSDQARRINYIKEIVTLLSEYSDECEKEFPKIKDALLKVARVKSLQNG